MTLETEILDSITSVYNERFGTWDSTDDMLTALAEAAAHTAEHHDSTPLHPEDSITVLRKAVEYSRIQLAPRLCLPALARTVPCSAGTGARRGARCVNERQTGGASARPRRRYDPR